MPSALRDNARLPQARVIQDERDPECRFVGEDSVRRLAVLAKRFAVVRCQDDERRRAVTRREDRVDERRQRRVDRGHVVCVRLRVRVVRLEEMHPAEVRLHRPGIHPAACERDRVRAAPLLQQERTSGARVEEAVVVDVEAAVEPEPRVERERADERAGPVTAILQDRGEGRSIGRKPKPGVVPDAVLGGKTAAQYVCVRRKCKYVVGPRLVEPEPGGRQSIHPGCPGAARSGRADGVGA